MATPVKVLSEELRAEVIDLYKTGLSYMAISKILCSRGDNYGPAVIGREMRKHAPEIIMRGQRKKFDEEAIAKINKLYDSGMSVNSIAEKVGAAFDTVVGVIDNFEYRYAKRSFECPDVDRLREMAESAEYSLEDMCQEFGVSRIVIPRWIEEEGITITRYPHPPKLPEDVLEKLTDEQWMRESYSQLGTVGMSNVLGIADGTVGRYLDKLGIERDKVFITGVSEPEKELAAFVESLGFDIVRNSRKIIPPKELDVYIPGEKFALEFNGLYWHSEDKVGRTYHFDKWKACQNKGIRLFQVWEDDWYDKREIVERLIAQSLDGYASDLGEVSYLSQSEAYGFLNRYHLEGAPESSDIRLGVKRNDFLAACMTFSGNTISRHATIGPDSFSSFLEFFRTHHSDQIVVDVDICTSEQYDGFQVVDFLPPEVRVDNSDVGRIYDAGKMRLIADN